MAGILRRKAKRIKDQVMYRFVLEATRRFPIGNDDHLLFLPDRLERPEGKRILVMAPHYDDETLGPGGTLVKHSQAGEKVHVLFFTDGRAGNPGGWTEAELIETRRREARQAAKMLGIEDLRFLDYPDQALPVDDASIHAVRSVFESVLPDLVYMPFPLDVHPDHAATAHITVAAALAAHSTAAVICYEAACPLMPNLVIPITGQIETKREAIRCYQTQMATNDYIHAIADGLNRFRTHGLLGGKGYAEAFFATDWGYLDTLLQRLNLGITRRRRGTDRRSH
ncbi:PIG-L family deacetylase [bacterium]|nr:PIG-L family deacetylase [candidate division CSSED10-310 bacterium]